MVLVYSAACILSAFLVFFIQPVVAKIALPVLGGTPMVWNGCMLFFQAMLLLGYSYAHVLGRLPVRRQPVIHLLFILAALASFPVGFQGAASIDPTYKPLLWLMVSLLSSVGLPFFVISASSPLLQKWFSRTNHPHASHPYFLYAASNMGSMGALFAYPALVEPYQTLLEQVAWWEWGIGLLALLFLAAAIYLLRRQSNQLTSATTSPAQKLQWRQRLHWVVLASVPSSLLYGVTSYITTDLVAVPMLWLAPLVLYLLTFILVFDRHMRGVRLARRLHMPFVFFAALLSTMPGSQSPAFLIVHLLVFFAAAMTLHAKLSDSKPSPAHLTEFFIWMSVGGVLGGAFNTFLAPHLFDSIAEYPLMLLLSCALRLHWHEMKEELRTNTLKVGLWAMAVIALIYAVWMMLGDDKGLLFTTPDNESSTFVFVRLAALTGACIFAARFDKKPAAWALGLGIICIGASMIFAQIVMGSLLYQERSVFGVNRVLLVNNTHIFMHGTTMHGIQSQDGKARLQPNAYYWILKDVFGSLPTKLRNAPVAAMGMGAGTVACHGKPNQQFDFYEIDPVVSKIASDPHYFTYLQDCPATKTIILGDARRQVSSQADKKYGFIIVDTFSSDTIPVHMITREATQLYLDKLQDQGMIAFHVSNRYIELRPVLSAIAADLGLAAVTRGPIHEQQGPWVQPSVWVVLARSPQTLKPLLARHDGWKELPSSTARYLWTDDFSNIFRSLMAFQTP